MLLDLNFKQILNVQFENEYKDMLEDLLKYITLVTILNCMFYLKTKLNFFNGLYVDVLLFLSVSICAYHLVIKKIIKFN